MSFPLVWGFLLVGALLGAFARWLPASAGPAVFRSLAKMEFQSTATAGDEQELKQALESPALLEAASNRAWRLHPEVQGSTITTRVGRKAGDVSLFIVAEGSEPKHTQILLNALLDEFFLKHQSPGKVGSPPVTIVQRATAPTEHVAAISGPVLLGALAGGLPAALLGLLVTHRRGIARSTPLPSVPH
jgi:hypothetical protein